MSLRTISFVWVDHENNRFVDLGRFRFDSIRDLDRAWDSIPSEPEGDLLADLDRGQGVEPNKYVSIEFIEMRCERSIEELKATGTAEALKSEAFIRDSLAQSTTQHA